MLKIIGYLLALSLAGCIVLVWRKHERLKQGVRFEGRVVGHVRAGSSKGGSLYHLKVAYTDESGSSREFEQMGPASSPPSRSIGARVTVLRLPDGTQEALVFESLYFAYWLWFCLGLTATGCLAAPRLLEQVYGRLPEGVALTKKEQLR